MSQSQTSKDSKLQIKDLNCQELVDERELELIVGGLYIGILGLRAGVCLPGGGMGIASPVPNPLP